MQHKRYGWGLAAMAVTVLFAGACANSTNGTEGAPSPASGSAASASPSATNSDGAHNDADVSFARMMIPHHQQAIEMSDMLLSKQGIEPDVVNLASGIKSAQGPEIEQMQSWLQEWGVSSTPSATGMPGHDMPGHDMQGDDAVGDMPPMAAGHGMMSEADMAALQNAQGAEASRLFLEQMISHHEGAITMAQQEIDDGQFAPAIDMARNIVSSQQAEIEEMQALLRN